MKPKPAEDLLTLKYVPLDTIVKWTRNTKKHDIPTIIKSFEIHGFKDPLKYEPALNRGSGGIAEGNGRQEALRVMRDQNPNKPPRGIGIVDGQWMVPVLFGVDAKSEKAAESYGFDHNNITVMGAGGDLDDIMAMYEDQTAALLLELQNDGNLPVSISADGLDAMLEADHESLREREETLRPKNMLRILISVPAAAAMDIQEYIEAIQAIPGAEIDTTGN